ncbi:hypothetical protein NIES4071_07460 [Calothrix sp. NIES-4071]|nr:hypothetical protein NIES4071_07460 [Calothrix sp. NIES-4071]BAZ55088.1 hypothetical protein NIES4105_07420 [Calothrix sp. NIES-4105]
MKLEKFASLKLIKLGQLLLHTVLVLVYRAVEIKSYLKSQRLTSKHIRVETLSRYRLHGIIIYDATNQDMLYAFF